MNLALYLDRAATISLQDQLFEQLRELILTGKLKPNSRVIATRFLAEQAGVSRTTVLLAYERLISEGYLEARPTVGTFVSGALPAPSDRDRNCGRPSQPSAAALAPRAATPARLHIPNEVVDFAGDRVDSACMLPEKVWLQSIRHVLERERHGLDSPIPAAGALPLRRGIADYLAATRGIMASPEQVIIVAGRRQACSLIAHVVLHRGDRVIVESPGDEEVAGFFRARGADLVSVPVDEDGLETDCLPDGPAALAYVTPTRQAPLGGTLPPRRAQALLQWARDTGAHLIEDHSDCQIRYHGTTPQALAALDPLGRVFHTGSFAPTLGARIGLGYMLVPQAFVEPILAIKAMADSGGAWLEQMVAADLLAGGGYDHHLRRVRKVYLERRDALIDALHSHFGEVRLIGSELGSQLTWVLPDSLPSANVVRDLACAHGVRVAPVVGDETSLAGTCRFHDRALILGYGALTPDRLRHGVAQLAAAVKG